MINVYISSILLFFTVFFLGAIVNSTLIYTVKSTGAVASSWGFISTSILIGFVLVVVPVAYGLSFDIPNHYLFYLPFIIALAASLVGLKDHKKFIHSFCSHLNYKNLIIITILFSLSILLVNTGKEELLKIRLGIDAALYTQAAQELLDGSTFGQLKAEYSIAAFIVHLRWGVPILMYFFAKILGATSVFEILPAFYLLCTFVLLTTTYAVIGSVTKSKIYGVYFTILLALNVNLVNALWECQWANFIALPFISFIILLFSTDGLTKGDRNYRYLTFILLLSFVILVFSEIIPAIFIFFVFCAFALGLTNIGKFKENIVFIAVGFACAFLLVSPYTAKLIPHLIGLSVQGAGYNIPVIAYPSDIIGLTNPFANVDLWLVPELSVKAIKHYNKFSSVLISGIVIFCFFYKIDFKNKLNIVSVCAAFFVFIGYLYFALHKSNVYAYMKLYITFLLILHFRFCDGFNKIINNKSAPFLKYALILLVLSITASNYESYREQFFRTTRVLTLQNIDFANYINGAEIYCYFHPPERGRGTQNMRYVDRSYENVQSVLFKNLHFVDQWSGGVINPKIGIVDHGESDFCKFVDLVR